MPTNPLQSSLGQLLIAKQSVEGTPAASGYQKMFWTDGNIASEPRFVTAEAFDGEVYSSPEERVANYETKGTVTVLADAQSTPILLSGVLGPDVVEEDEDNEDLSVHVMDTDAPGRGAFFTFYTQVDTVMRRFTDCKITKVTIRATADKQFVECVFEVVGIQAHANVTSLPSATPFNKKEAYSFSDGAGQYKVSDVGGVSGTRGINQFEVVFDRDQDPWQGDGFSMYAVIAKRGQVSMGATLLADDNSLPLLNRMWYGTDSPANGTQPTAAIFYDSFDLKLERTIGGVARSITISLPEVGYRTGTSIEPNIDGSAIEIPVEGRAVKEGSDPMATVTIVNEVADAY